MCSKGRVIALSVCQSVSQSVDTKMTILNELGTPAAFSCNIWQQMKKNNLHFTSKNHTMSYETRGFLLSVQIIEQNHTSISILPTITYGSTFILNKAQSALSTSAHSTAHWINALLDTSCQGRSGWINRSRAKLAETS